MAAYLGFRKFFEQILDEPFHRGTLGSGAGIFITALGTASDVADADGIFIVMEAVRSFGFECASSLAGAVDTDDVMVAHAGETTLLVPAVDVENGEVPAFFGIGTMEDNQIDISHISRSLGSLNGCFLGFLG